MGIIAKVHPHPRLSIVANPTDGISGSSDRPVDLRTELLGQILAAQFELESTLAELEGSGALVDVVRTSLQALGDLRRQVGFADPAALNQIRGEIAASAASARTIAQQTRSASQSELAQLALAEVDARTRATVERVAGDLFERKVLDPYLQFASADEEAEYRRREAERKGYIERELARGTPEGNLNASIATVAQIEDAGAHGADKSPDYQALLRDAKGARDEQNKAIVDTQATLNVPAISPSPSVDDADLDEIAAVLRSAGVVGSAEVPSSEGHGLAANGADSKAASTGRST